MVHLPKILYYFLKDSKLVKPDKKEPCSLSTSQAHVLKSHTLVWTQRTNLLSKVTNYTQPGPYLTSLLCASKEDCLANEVVNKVRIIVLAAAEFTEKTDIAAHWVLIHLVYKPG